VYQWITFQDKLQGMIVGTWLAPQSSDELPDWMVPDRARYRHQFPSVIILLQTIDGGKTWTELSRSMEGALTKFRYAPSGGWGLALFEYPNSAHVPGELIRMDLKTQKNLSVLTNPDRVVRDFLILANGDVLIAATERQGKANVLPIPGKLKIMHGSSAMKTWLDMDVDYRAVATRVMLAAADENDVWAATDTGMILKLTH
jgi:hypothetical protein